MSFKTDPTAITSEVFLSVTKLLTTARTDGSMTYTAKKAMSTIQCIRKLTKNLLAFAKGSHVPVHKNVTKPMRCLY